MSKTLAARVLASVILDYRRINKIKEDVYVSNNTIEKHLMSSIHLSWLIPELNQAQRGIY